MDLWRFPQSVQGTPSKIEIEIEIETEIETEIRLIHVGQQRPLAVQLV